MIILSFDVGSKRTGVAMFDDRIDIVLSLATIKHTSAEELLTVVRTLVAERGATLVVLGLPLLPSGERGKQAELIDALATQLRGTVEVALFDERYTTNRRGPVDPDAASACEILRTYLASEQSKAAAKTPPKRSKKTI